MAGGYLTTHVLDTALGLPARGLEIALYRLDDGNRQALATAITNADGRTDQPVLPAASFRPGLYELVFEAGAYLRARGAGAGETFLEAIPIRFRITDPDAHLHVPLLLSDFSYATYRGS